jgi:hypothetical protein
MQTAAPTTLATYKARWEDFRIECENLDYARRLAYQGFVNETLSGDEAWAAVCRLEDRHARDTVARRADVLMDAYYLRADM